MDSLLATYASSDEEQEDSGQPQLKQNQSHESSNSTPPKSAGALFSSLPPPKSSSQSLFSSIPPPKSQTLVNPLAPIPKLHNPENQEPEKPKSSAVFSSLPQHKTRDSENPQISSGPKPKKVVQFRPPVNLSVFNSKDDEEDSDEEKPKKKSVGFETPTVTSFLSSIPAPKNSGSFGALPSAAGTGRRSILEADVRPAIPSAVKTVSEKLEDVGYGGSSDSAFGAIPLNLGSGSGSFVNHDVNHDNYGGAEASNLGSGSSNFVNYDHYSTGNPSSYGPVSEDYSSYDDNENYGQYESRWIDRSNGEVSIPAVENVGAQISSSAVENVIRIGKRGRNDIPHDVVEVNQDELMKNRPREDKVKSTGIAFGPAYQPVSTKGKPTKLHKRKHQIGSLYFDMRQKESELAERRSKGFLTKAETHAKYGW